MKKEFPYKRILVIDDNEVDFFLAHTHIKNYDRSACVYFAMDVDSGMAMYKSFKPEEKPDLILIDLCFNRQQKQGADFINEFNLLPKEVTQGTRLMVLTSFSGYNEGLSLNKNQLGIILLEKPFEAEKVLAK